MGIYRNEECDQKFYLDGTVIAMEEDSKGWKTSGRTAFFGLHYYLQDELGSPVRVSGFKAKENAPIGRSSYLAYGYDEFGNDLGKEQDEAGVPNPYDEQELEQPFGYTGYRYDAVGGTYFAQAREYQAENGRFEAEDVIKGNASVLAKLNVYQYSYSNPLNYVDTDGREGYYFYSDNFDEDVRSARGDVESDIAKLEEYYNYEFEIIPICVKNEEEFIQQWNLMDDTYGIDVVIIYTHAAENRFYFTDPDSTDYDKQRLFVNELNNLEDKDIELLVSIGCNTGGVNKNKECMATALLDTLPGIDYVVAANRTVTHSGRNGKHKLYAQTYKNGWNPINMAKNFYNRTFNNKGFLLFDRSQEIFLDYKYNSVADLVEDALNHIDNKN